MERKIIPARLEEFLIAAKKNSYASGNKPRLVNGFEEFEFKGREFYYLDRYVGSSSFCGIETVSFSEKNEKPIWAMVYSGHLTMKQTKKNKERIFKFLRDCLKEVPVYNPFRGPKNWTSKPFMYINNYTGNIKRFKGNENIFIKNDIVYELDYRGGLLI